MSLHPPTLLPTGCGGLARQKQGSIQLMPAFLQVLRIHGFHLCLSFRGIVKKKEEETIKKYLEGTELINFPHSPSHPNSNHKKVKTRCTAEWLYSSQSVGGARAPRS